MVFLYFISLQSNINREHVARQELPYLWDSERPVVVGCKRGPDDPPTGGIVVGHGERVGHYPEQQEWAHYGNVWIGWSGSKPTPDALRRPRTFASHKVLLADGNYWDIPIVCYFAEGGLPTALPCYMGRNPLSGAQELRVDEEYRPLYDEALRVRAVVFGEMLEGAEGAEVEVDEQKLVEDLLSINYRVSWRECDLLRLIRNDLMGDVIEAMLDIPSLKSAQKAAAREEVAV